jgi:hypothetical protein
MSNHPNIRPFTDAEYSVMVLLGLQRMVRRTDYATAWLTPRDIMRENVNQREVLEALQTAIDALRFQQRITDEQALEAQRQALIRRHEEVS